MVDDCNYVFTTKGRLRHCVRVMTVVQRNVMFVARFLFNSCLAKHMKSHNMQRSQWYHCPHNDCDLMFTSKSNFKHHTSSHAALDSGLTFPCDKCDYVGKTANIWLIINIATRNINAVMLVVVLCLTTDRS